MKKIKLSLVMIAVVLGSIGAVATKASAHKSSGGTNYYWFNTSGVYQDENTPSAEQTRTGCTGSSTTCENGYIQSQLVNPNDPSDGVKSGETAMDQIFQAD